MIRFYILRHLFFALSVFVLSGCAGYVSNTLRDSFSSSKSMIIIPQPIVYDRRIYWSGAGDEDRKDYFYEGYDVGYCYVAISKVII
jgi:hypothetical protein